MESTGTITPSLGGFDVTFGTADIWFATLAEAEAFAIEAVATSPTQIDAALTNFWNGE